jgi:hypothetical protein
MEPLDRRRPMAGEGSPRPQSARYMRPRRLAPLGRGPEVSHRRHNVSRTPLIHCYPDIPLWG